MAYDMFGGNVPHENTPKTSHESVPDSIGLSFIGNISPCCLVSISRHSETLEAPGNRIDCTCGTIIKAKSVVGSPLEISVNKSTGLREYVPASGKVFTSILFDKLFWSEAKAERYLLTRGIENFAQRPSNQSYAYILCPTEWVEEDSVQVSRIDNGVVGIIGKTKDEYVTLSDEALDMYVDKADHYKSF